MTGYPLRILDHHGVLHGVRLPHSSTVCAAQTRNGAPWGCKLTDEVGRWFVANQADPADVKYCPICYPKGKPQ